MTADALETGLAKKVLYELERGREFGVVPRVVMQNYELIRRALIEYAERGAGMPNKDLL